MQFKSFSKSFVTLLCILSTSGCVRGIQDLMALRQQNLEADLENYYNEVQVPVKEMDLNEIIATALSRNLDILIQQHELAIQKEVTGSEKLRMLPSLNINGELGTRNRHRGNTSVPLSGSPESSGSISDERFTKKADLTLAWSILDFGLSYYNAKRELNKERILSLQHQRIRQNLVLDVIKAYWRTVVAKEAADGAVALIKIAEDNQEELQERVERRIVSEMHGLESENQLIEIQIKLHNFRNEYHTAKTELAALMGLPPEADFELKGFDMFSIDHITYQIEELENTALTSRPELFAQDVEEAVLGDDIRATMIQMFPNFNLFAGHNFDDDRFLVHQNWFSAGIRTSWNLLSIPSLVKRRKSLKHKKEFLRNSRIALSMGILTQVHLAHLEYQEAVSQHHLSEDLLSVKERLLQAAQKEYKQGLLDDVDMFNFEVEALFAKVNTLKSYALLHASLEKIANSIGTPLSFYPDQDKVHLLLSEYHEMQQSSSDDVAEEGSQESSASTLNASGEESSSLSESTTTSKEGSLSSTATSTNSGDPESNLSETSIEETSTNSEESTISETTTEDNAFSSTTSEETSNSSSEESTISEVTTEDNAFSSTTSEETSNSSSEESTISEVTTEDNSFSSTTSEETSNSSSEESTISEVTTEDNSFSSTTSEEISNSSSEESTISEVTTEDNSFSSTTSEETSNSSSKESTISEATTEDNSFSSTTSEEISTTNQESSIAEVTSQEEEPVQDTTGLDQISIEIIEDQGPSLTETTEAPVQEKINNTSDEVAETRATIDDILELL